MKKIIAIAFAAVLALVAISCQKENFLSEEQNDTPVQYTFNISVNDQFGFDNGTSTKGGSSESYKTGWESGDRVFLFFKPASGSLLTDTYATLKYNGSSWDGSVTGTSNLGEAGTLSAVYVYKLSSSVEPVFADSQWTIATGNTFYNCQAGVSYTVSGSEINASLNLVAPANFVRFYVKGSPSGPLTCDKVKGWKDVAIGGDLAVSNITCTGYMGGFANSGDSNVMEYYGRVVDGVSLKDESCKFSVVKNGKVYEHTATPTTDGRSFSMITTTWTETPGKLPGLFTAGKGADNTAGTADDVLVRFSKGNMFWDGDSFEFEANQYDYPTTWSDSHVSNLFWSKTASASYVKDYNGTDASLSDVLFTNATPETAKSDFTVNGETGRYRTLSKDEWKYLFGTSADRNGKYKLGVTVCDKQNCVIIAPDNWDLSANPLLDAYTSSTWPVAEAAGLVCLPAAGSRDANLVYSGEEGAYYWSSSASGSDKAYFIAIEGAGWASYDADDRKFGDSVRLVTDVK